MVYGKNTRALIKEIVKTINTYFNNMLIELHKAVLRDQAETFKYVYVRMYTKLYITDFTYILQISVVSGSLEPCISSL